MGIEMRCKIYFYVAYACWPTHYNTSCKLGIVLYETYFIVIYFSWRNQIDISWVLYKPSSRCISVALLTAVERFCQTCMEN